MNGQFPTYKEVDVFSISEYFVDTVKGISCVLGAICLYEYFMKCIGTIRGHVLKHHKATKKSLDSKKCYSLNVINLLFDTFTKRCWLQG